MESPGQRDRHALLTEAARIREQVSALKRQRLQDPDNGALREEHQRLKARYQRIGQLLQQPPTAPSSPLTAEVRRGVEPALPAPSRAAVPIALPAPTGFPFNWEDLREGLREGLPVGFRLVRTAITSVLILFVVAFAYFYLAQDMRFFIVPTRSMQPTLHPMDRIVTLKAPTYAHGDIVVFSDPDHPGDYLAKRIVAVAGETISIDRRTLILNGHAVREPYIPEPMEFHMTAFTVPAGEVFVMGDNRNQSEDSRDWRRGVPVDEIRGRVVYVYMPFDRFQRLSRERIAFAEQP